MEKGTIRNKKTGKPYEVTRSEWETILRNPGFAADYELIKDFPPVVDLDDLPEVQAINNPPVEPEPEEPAAPPTENIPNDEPAQEQPAKTGKKKNDKA
jgi:hypothetical protein